MKTQYHVAVGIALILFGCLAIFTKTDVAISHLALIIFGASLLSTSVISSLKFGPTGFELQTLKQATGDVASVLQKHEQALMQISDAILALNNGLDSANKVEEGIRPRSVEVLKGSVASTIEGARSVIETASGQTRSVARRLGASGNR